MVLVALGVCRVGELVTGAVLGVGVGKGVVAMILGVCGFWVAVVIFVMMTVGGRAGLDG